jgi:hypothetical protein
LKKGRKVLLLLLSLLLLLLSSVLFRHFEIWKAPFPFEVVIRVIVSATSKFTHLLNKRRSLLFKHHFIMLRLCRTISPQIKTISLLFPELWNRIPIWRFIWHFNYSFTWFNLMRRCRCYYCLFRQIQFDAALKYSSHSPKRDIHFEIILIDNQRSSWIHDIIIFLCNRQTINPFCLRPFHSWTNFLLLMKSCRLL